MDHLSVKSSTSTLGVHAVDKPIIVWTTCKDLILPRGFVKEREMEGVQFDANETNIKEEYSITLLGNYNSYNSELRNICPNEISGFCMF